MSQPCFHEAIRAETLVLPDVSEGSVGFFNEPRSDNRESLPARPSKDLRRPRRRVLTLLRLRAALSFPPGVRFLSCTSRRSTSWTMAFTVYVMSPAWRFRLVCSASSLAMTAAVSPALIYRKLATSAIKPQTCPKRDAERGLPPLLAPRHRTQLSGGAENSWSRSNYGIKYCRNFPRWL